MILIPRIDSYHPKMESSRSSSNDIISNLPTNVKELILTHLPIRDAARTSIISRNWRYCWLYLPKLVFDDTLWQELTARQPFFTKNQIVFAIYQVLLLHRGPILEFTLSVSVLESCSEIDQLILFLSRKSVKRFVLHIWKGDHYKLPSSFFSCPKLIHLNLHSCVFNPPASFNGFSQLISVEFFGVTISAEILESFISSCPLLERLKLTTSASFEYFNINALRLKYLFIRGHLKSIFFQNAPLLTEVSIGLYSSLTKEQIEQGGTSNFHDIFVCLPGLKKLTLDFYIIQVLLAS